ncbi:MAG TPA: penicillin-binding transpeptidase domain-containing protein [Chloroflexota bacterium]
MNTNIRRMGAFFVLAFILIVAGLTYWQVIDAASMQSRSDNPRLRTMAAKVLRGRIFDRNGTLLADRTVDAHGVVHRVYADPTLSTVIGYDSPRFGKSALEKSYDSYLTGQEVGTNWKAQVDQWEHKPVVGDNLTLTIDDRLQQQVNSIMPDTPSAAIVADPRNGQILAMASKPGFDANQVNDPTYWQSLLNDPNAPLINRPVNGYYTPGSTFKIVTLSAALDSHAYSLSSGFGGQQATGPLTVDGHIYPDTINNLNDCGGRVIPPPITLEQALICSDNIVFAEVGLGLGKDRFLSYAQGFGLNSAPPFDIPVSASRTGPIPDRVALAGSAFGQGSLLVTPLQMLMADEAIATGGSIPQPALVQHVTAPDGSTVKTASTGTISRPISSGTAAQVKTAMTRVVAEGTGVLAQIPGVQIAGKTGTAETQDGRLPHAWFVCFAPADHPRVAVVVIVEHGGEGAYVAAPLAKRILQAALPLVH